jgi:hypothetical protein
VKSGASALLIEVAQGVGLQDHTSVDLLTFDHVIVALNKHCGVEIARYLFIDSCYEWIVMILK